jgi:hypothetical protein
MDIRRLLLAFAAAAALSNVVILILIMAGLDRRGMKTNMLVARIRPWKYLAAYKEATQKETGKPGPLYVLSILTINLALLLALAAILGPWG